MGIKKEAMSAVAFQALKKRLRAKVSKANKRVDRLEKNGYEGMPAYRQYQDLKQGNKFTSAGKDLDALRKEEARVDKFLKSKTSTIGGSKKVMGEMAKRHKIPFKTKKDLLKATKQYFELYSKAGQYLKNKGSYYAMDSDQVFENVSEYVEQEAIDLGVDVDVNEIMPDLLDDIENKQFNTSNTKTKSNKKKSRKDLGGLGI